MRFLGLVANQGGLFHLPENTFLKKSVAKTVARKVPSPETRINTGFFGTSKPKGTTPTLYRDYHLYYFISILSYFCTVLGLFFFVLFSLSFPVLQNMLQLYAFDVLMEIYRECGYSDRDAALNIVQHNLYGMDIDKRAYQLAYFAVMMKARSYNRRAFANVR